VATYHTDATGLVRLAVVVDAFDDAPVTVAVRASSLDAEFVVRPQ
jgi:hypothetical protein